MEENSFILRDNNSEFHQEPFSQQGCKLYLLLSFAMWQLQSTASQAVIAHIAVTNSHTKPPLKTYTLHVKWAIKQPSLRRGINPCRQANEFPDK
jgi:hypothetical protein